MNFHNLQKIKNMANVFKEAKKISRAHPRMPWQECVKKAGARIRRGVSGTHRRKSAKKSKHGRKKVGAISRNTDKVDRKNVSVNIGNVSTATVKSYLKKQTEEKIAWALLAKSQAKTKTAKKKIQAKINADKKLLNQL